MDLSPHVRLAQGCGWLLGRSLDAVFPSPPEWPDVYDEKDTSLDARTCPGYLVQLPQVIEAARLVTWSRSGQLATRLAPLVPTPAVFTALDILEGQQAAVDAWRLEPKK